MLTENVEQASLQNDVIQVNLANSPNKNLTKVPIDDWRIEAGARQESSYGEEIPVLNPRTKWIGGELKGAQPVDTTITKFVVPFERFGLHVLDLFFGYFVWGLTKRFRGWLQSQLLYKCGDR